MKLSTIFINEDFKTQFKKFTEKDGVDKDTVNYYFKYFKKIKSKYPKAFEMGGINISIPPEKRKDIDSYQTFKELEQVVDYLRGQVNIEDDAAVSVSGDTTIYEDDNLKISKGTSPQSCVSIRQAGSEGKNISWCVARETGSLYYSYRLGSNEGTFYFVKNKNKNKSDKYFFFVIQVTNTGGYIVTSAENDGDKPMSWEQIIEIEPLLVNLKEIFKHDKVKPEEREAQGLDKVNNSTYPSLTYNQKKKYIEGLRKLSDSMFKVTPIELLEYYVNLNAHLLSTNQIIFLEKKNPKLLKRYYVLLNRKIENNEFFKNLKKLDDDSSYEVDLDQYKGGDLITSVSLGRYNTIELDVKNIDDVYSAADINPNALSYVKSCASGYNDGWNRYQLSSMWSFFDTETEDLMIKLLTFVGVPEKDIDTIDREGKLEEILKNFDFDDKIFEAFMSEHASAEERAKEEAAKEMLKAYNELPLEFNDGRYATINITDINDFITAIISIDPTISNFEDAVIKLLESADLGGDDLYDLQEYEYYDSAELNTEMRRVIESIIEDVESEGYGEYFGKIADVLDKLGFKNDKISNEIVEITIENKFPDYDKGFSEELLKDPIIKIRLVNKKTNKTEVGDIKLSSLPNYVHNYQLFEETNRIKKLLY